MKPLRKNGTLKHRVLFLIYILMNGKALIVQGGGPTVVINQSLVGAILEAWKHPEISGIYGAKHGVRGVRDEQFVDLTNVSVDNLEGIAQMPGAILGSTRDKPDSEYCIKMFDVMKKHNIRYFFLIGGNDGATVCHILNEEAKKVGFEFRVIHIPKTVDNDLVGTDHCPGFGSAARYVALAFRGIDFDNRSLPGVYIGVVMGRHAGFLTASSVLAKTREDSGPHLMYTPEKPFDIHHFVHQVKEVFDKYGRCIVAVSEGITDKDGALIATLLTKQIEHDAHGNVALAGSGMLGDLLVDTIKTRSDISRVRQDTFGYPQRSFFGCVSTIDSQEAREVGVRAVQFAMTGDVDGSVAITRTDEYHVEYQLIPLEVVAGKTKHMPDDFFESDTMVNERFLQYLRPLVGDLEDVVYLDAPIINKVI